MTPRQWKLAPTQHKTYMIQNQDNVMVWNGSAAVEVARALRTEKLKDLSYKGLKPLQETGARITLRILLGSKERPKNAQQADWGVWIAKEGAQLISETLKDVITTNKLDEDAALLLSSGAWSVVANPSGTLQKLEALLKELGAVKAASEGKTVEIAI